MSDSAGTKLPSVLLVDDEAAWLDVMRTGLADEFEVETVQNAQQAASILARRHFDVVVCDHLMPGEAGVDFLIKAREQFPGTKRVLLTGYMNPELIARSVAIAGLSACLLKPMGPVDLARAIRTVVPSV